MKWTVACLLWLSLTGCATFEVGSASERTTESSTGHETVHGSLYGFRWRPYLAQKCHESGIAYTQHTYSWLQLVSSAISLGLYVPQTIMWWCEDPRPDEDENAPEPDPHREFGQ